MVGTPSREKMPEAESIFMGVSLKFPLELHPEPIVGDAGAKPLK